MSELRRRMIQDMQLAGLTEQTQKTYIGAVRQLAAHYRTAPDKLSEEQLRDYLIYLRDEVYVAKGTFTTHFHGLKLFFVSTLGRDWPLLTKKSASTASEAFATGAKRCRLPSLDSFDP